MEFISDKINHFTVSTVINFITGQNHSIEGTKIHITQTYCDRTTEGLDRSIVFSNPHNSHWYKDKDKIGTIL